MTASVNFLPWRQSRQRKRIRRACLMAGLVLLAVMATGGIRYGELRARRAALIVHIDAERQLIRALAQREAAFRERERVAQQRQREYAARQHTAAWEARLVELAEKLPARAWLTELTYQNEVLSLSGALMRPAVLRAVDETLRQMAGFSPAVAGKMTRDKAGRWLFNYQMKRRADDATP